jgi:hypothetical protein
MMLTVACLFFISAATHAQTPDASNPARTDVVGGPQTSLIEEAHVRLQMTPDEWAVLAPFVNRVIQAMQDAHLAIPVATEETTQAARSLKAVLDDPNSDANSIQSKLDALRGARRRAKTTADNNNDVSQEAKAALAKAQDDLRNLLTPRQQAEMVLIGLLDADVVLGAQSPPLENQTPSTAPADTPTLHIVESGVSFAGAIKLTGDIPSLDNKAFACTQAPYIKNGSQFAARGSWSMDTDSVEVDGRAADVPTIAMLSCSDGSSLCVFPAVLKAKIDMKAGEIIHSDGYEIQTTRAVKAGETIAVFRVGDTSVVSVASDGKGANADASNPWFTAFKEATKTSDRSVSIDAWHAEWRRLLYR